MAGVNKAILIGNLGRDPELRRTPAGAQVVSFPLATTERRTDRNGQKQEYTEWHNIVAWNRRAELANQYLKKGRSVYVEGRIQTRSWDDRDGNKRYKTEIVASTIQFLGSPSGQTSNSTGQMSSPNNGAGQTDYDDYEAPKSDDNFSSEAAGESKNESNEANAVAEDDLPF